MIGLLFKINGDSSGFSREMDKTKDKAKQGGQTVGKAFGEQFKSAMMSYIGAGAILGAFRKALQEATQIETGAIKLNIDPAAFQELTKAAELLGMSVDELQTVAPEAAGEFEKLMTTIREGGGILDSETVETLADTADAMDRLWAQMQPGLGFFVKLASWIVGQGERVLTANAGMAMAGYGTAKRLVTGNDDIQRAGVELYREAKASTVEWGASPIASDRRKAAREMSSALRANRQAVATARRDDAVTGSMMREIPFLGGVTKDLIDGMWKIADEQKRTRAELSKRL